MCILFIWILCLSAYLNGAHSSLQSNSTIKNADGSLRPINEIMHANRETIDAWIQEVGDVNHEDEDDVIHRGGTALIWAVIYGRKDIVEYLIQIGANINQEIKQTGETVLITAIRNGQMDIVEYLIQRGANVNHRNKSWDWDTPLMWAVLSGNQRIVKLMLDKGAKPGPNSTELISAVMNGNIEIANLLIQRGANLNHPVNIGLYTPIFFAVEDGNDKMVEFLLQRGANINSKSCDGDTALHIAAGLEPNKNPDKLVGVLLRYGGNRYTRNDNGKTPLDLAADKGNTKVITLLSTNA